MEMVVSDTYFIIVSTRGTHLVVAWDQEYY